MGRPETGNLARLEVASSRGRRTGHSAYAYKVLEDGMVEVYNLDFAAFCLMRGLKIGDMLEEGPKQRGKPPRYRFLFSASDEEIRRMSVDYNNSECARFADCVKRLKSSIRSTCPREG